MRVLFAHQLPKKNEVQKRRIKSTVALIENSLRKVLANSFEIVIRDYSNLNDHLYDPTHLDFNNPQNKSVSCLNNDFAAI